MDNDKYSILRVDYMPWDIVWLYNDGRKIAQCTVYEHEIRKDIIKELKTKKEWKCDVCDESINVGESAVRFRMKDCNLYTHKNCVHLNIR